jgi:hypothetical protein
MHKKRGLREGNAGSGETIVAASCEARRGATTRPWQWRNGVGCEIREVEASVHSMKEGYQVKCDTVMLSKKDRGKGRGWREFVSLTKY